MRNYSVLRPTFSASGLIFQLSNSLSFLPRKEGGGDVEICCRPHFPSSKNGVGGQLPHGVGGVAAALGMSLELRWSRIEENKFGKIQIL